MKTFAANEKQSTSNGHKSHHSLYRSMDPAQQIAMRKILRPDEVQAKSVTDENDGNYVIEANRVMEGLSGGAALLQKSESEEPDEELQRQPEDEEDEPVQTKLTIGKPNDKYEKEADSIADQVMTMPDLKLQRQPEYEDEEEKLQAEPLVDQITPLVQRQEDHPEEEETIQCEFIQHQAEDEDEQCQTKQKSDAVNSPSQMTNTASKAIADKGSGRPLNPQTKSRLESGIGADFSSVRVHNDSSARDAAKGLKARAFTHKNDIWLGEGQSPDDVKLMAHEATHVVQQNAAPGLSNKVSRKTYSNLHIVQRESLNQTGTAGKAKGEQSTAPGVVELKGKPKLVPGESIDAWLDRQPQKTGSVNMQFGGFAKGKVKLIKRDRGYKIDQGFLPAKHEMFAKTGETAQQLQPGLIINTNKSGDAITGYVGLRAGSKIPKGSQDFVRKLRSAPDLIGLQGFGVSKFPKITNEIKDGSLELGLSDVPLALGRILNGTFSLGANEEKITSFSGNLSVDVPKLATVNMELDRTPEGKTKGKVDAAVQLTKNINGNVIVVWDDGNLSGEGSVGYAGDKFSGKVTLKVMERDKAEQLEQQKKAPEKEVVQKSASKGKSKAKPDYVLFGEGELDVTFSDWLGGKAQVIIDQKGFLTVIGKITPKDFELFPQKDYVKKLFKVEARASYGIPVVGNIFIFANIGADAFAKIGPGKFYKISIDGTYSNDPKKAKDFSIKGSFNISAAAGLRLRGEAGAGLEILAHDIKAGAGINGLAGIRGYAEATPVIGYREKPAPTAEDKKGEFYIRGDLEIAAQPFLGLSGDLFVEVDAPWWSPVPDKKWTWPLGGKEWPIGGSFGLNANIDYVFGSGKAPAVELKPVEFDSSKFLTDLYADKAQPTSKKADKPGTWKEKNTKDAPPSKEAKTGNAKLGKAEALPAAKSKVKPAVGKKDVKPANPNSRTANGKTVKEYQKEARQKEGKPDLKSPMKGKGKEGKTGKADTKKDKQDKWQRGVKVVKQTLSYAEKTGIDQKELNGILKKIMKRKEYGFNQLYAKESPKDKQKWTVFGAMSPVEQILTLAKSKMKFGEKKFVNNAGEEHVLSISGEGKTAKLLMASNSKGPLRIYLADLKIVKSDPRYNAMEEAKRLASKTLADVGGTSDQERSKNVEDDLNKLSIALKTLASNLSLPLPPKAKLKYSDDRSGVGKYSKLDTITTENSTVGTKPSGSTKEFDQLRAHGLTSGAGIDKWVRMHLVSEELGGKGVKENWVPAPNSVNTGTQVLSQFEAPLKRLLYKGSKGANGKDSPSVIWVKGEVLDTHAPDASTYKLKDFPSTVEFTAGLYFPKGKKWEKDTKARFKENVPIRKPDKGKLPSLSIASYTALSAVEGGEIFTRTMTKIMKVVSKGGNEPYRSVANMINRIKNHSKDPKRNYSRLYKKFDDSKQKIKDLVKNKKIRVG